MNLKSKNTMEIKKINRNIIYKLIYKSDGLSKQDIVNKLGLSLPTVTQNLKYLKEQNLITENGEFESSGGRKAKIITCVKDSKLSLGIDITKNHISMVVLDLMGSIINSIRISKRFLNKEEYFIELNSILENFIEESNVDREKILGVGISVPGILSDNKKSIVYSHALELRNLDCANFYNNIHYPCVMSNDASAAGIAEIWHCDSTENVLYLSLSNTVGGAIILNNKLYEGENQKSGEIGHMTLMPDGKECYCGKKGCVDPYISALRLSENCSGNLGEFFDLVNKGDEKLVKNLDSYLNYLSITVNNLRMIFDCNIILGGYVGAHMENYVQDLESKVKERNTFEKDTDFIKVCKYKREASAVGAALIYLDGFINSI